MIIKFKEFLSEIIHWTPEYQKQPQQQRREYDVIVADAPPPADGEDEDSGDGYESMNQKLEIFWSTRGRDNKYWNSRHDIGRFPFELLEQSDLPIDEIWDRKIEITNCYVDIDWSKEEVEFRLTQDAVNN